MKTQRNNETQNKGTKVTGDEFYFNIGALYLFNKETNELFPDLDVLVKAFEVAKLSYKGELIYEPLTKIGAVIYNKAKIRLKSLGMKSDSIDYMFSELTDLKNFADLDIFVHIYLEIEKEENYREAVKVMINSFGNIIFAIASTKLASTKEKVKSFAIQSLASLIDTNDLIQNSNEYDLSDIIKKLRRSWKSGDVAMNILRNLTSTNEAEITYIINEIQSGLIDYAHELMTLENYVKKIIALNKQADDTRKRLRLVGNEIEAEYDYLEEIGAEVSGHYLEHEMYLDAKLRAIKKETSVFKRKIKETDIIIKYVKNTRLYAFEGTDAFLRLSPYFADIWKALNSKYTELKQTLNNLK